MLWNALICFLVLVFGSGVSGTVPPASPRGHHHSACPRIPGFPTRQWVSSLAPGQLSGKIAPLLSTLLAVAIGLIPLKFGNRLQSWKSIPWCIGPYSQHKTHDVFFRLLSIVLFLCFLPRCFERSFQLTWKQCDCCWIQWVPSMSPLVVPLAYAWLLSRPMSSLQNMRLQPATYVSTCDISHFPPSYLQTLGRLAFRSNLRGNWSDAL